MRRAQAVMATLFAVAACSSSNSDLGADDKLADDPPSLGTPIDPSEDPSTCAAAAAAHSYVGCDYWPVVTGNSVFDIFDFAAVVSNGGTSKATVRVTGPNNVDKTVTVGPGAVEKIFLPWVASLKGPVTQPTGVVPITTSILERRGAYHLVSSVPVVVFQFNPLEYVGRGGPPGKSWANCKDTGGAPNTGCFSYTNDASLLLPSTAWTGNYRVTGIHGFSYESTTYPYVVDLLGPYVSITAAKNGTVVKLRTGAQGSVLAGTSIARVAPGGTVEIRLDAGDVAQVMGAAGERSDLSGSLIQSNQPVQVISGIQCTFLPRNKNACDHVEETILPAEALGKRYVVSAPELPTGGPAPHIVRFYGNRDETTLTYAPSRPPGCPATLYAGQVVECFDTVTQDFVVTASQEFGIASFQVSARVFDSGERPKGDPSQSIFASTEQYRRSYLFLAPDDYDVNYAVIVGPESAHPVLDDQKLDDYRAIGEGLGVWRVSLGPGKSGAHTLRADDPVGLQVMGYGAFTSYQYPGGMNAKLIAPPPVK